MHSMEGCCSASMYLLESFQQVIQQGESVQIMWMPGAAWSREGVLGELFSAGSRNACRPHQLTGGWRMASCTRHFGMA